MKTQKQKIPKIGEDVYVPTSLYLGHGVDDFQGGLCEIVNIEPEISAGKTCLFLEVKERPGHSYNWEVLMQEQDQLKNGFGEQRGYQDPDYDPRFNEGF